jgi:hypothetical protein
MYERPQTLLGAEASSIGMRLKYRRGGRLNYDHDLAQQVLLIEAVEARSARRRSRVGGAAGWCSVLVSEKCGCWL